MHGKTFLTYHRNIEQVMMEQRLKHNIKFYVFPVRLNIFQNAEAMLILNFVHNFAFWNIYFSIASWRIIENLWFFFNLIIFLVGKLFSQPKLNCMYLFRLINLTRISRYTKNQIPYKYEKKTHNCVDVRMKNVIWVAERLVCWRVSRRSLSVSRWCWYPDKILP